MASEENDRDENEQEEEVERPAPRAAKTKTPPRKANGVGAAAPASSAPTSKWTSREAELMWPEIIDWLTANGHSAYEVEIQVVRLTPAGPEGAVTLGRIDGNAVMGDQQVAPGDRLMQVIIDQFHMPTMRGPARYEVRFLWKVGAQRIGIGILNVPSPAEIIALRNAAYAAATDQREMPQQHGVGAPRPQQPQQPQPQPQQPWQQPPQYPPQPPYGMGYSPYGYGMPYGMPPSSGVHHEQGVSPDVATLSAALQHTKGMLDETLRAWREGRQPPGAGAAAPPPVSEEAIAEKVTARVLMALQKVGALGAPAQPAVATPPPSSVPTDARGMIDEMISGVFKTAVGTFRSNLEKSMRNAMGMGSPPEEATAEIAEPEPAKDEFKTPFDVAAVEDVRWPDGTPVRYAADRKTGDISPMGLAFGNPYMVEKAMGVAQGLTGALTDVLKSFAKGGQVGTGAPPPPPAPQVVREIPSTAVDASASAPEDDSNNGFPSI